MAPTRRLVSFCRPRRALAGAALGSLLLAAGGCGSSHSPGSAADPASLIPASASVYAGASVRPSGPLQAAASADGRALTHRSDPYLLLLGLLRAPGSPAPNYKREVAPWLGPRAGVYLGSSSAAAAQRSVARLLALLEGGLLGGSSASQSSPFAESGVEGAVLLDTSDSGKAQSFIREQARRSGAHPSSYRGVRYQTSANGLSFGLVRRVVVIGSAAGIQGVIDTAADGASLAQATAYSKLLSAAPAGALAHLYANAGAFRASGGAAPAGLSGALSLLAGGSIVNVSLVPAQGSLALDLDVLQAGTGALGESSQAARLVGELPAESWLALGLGNVGSTLGADVLAVEDATSLAGSPAPSVTSLSVKGLLGGILTPLRALGSRSPQARAAFAGWMGSAALFAAGTGLLELKGGIVIESKNPAKSRAAVSALAAALRRGGSSVQTTSIAGTDAAVAARIGGLPVVLDIADGPAANGASKFVIGIGEASVAAALHPTSTLASSSSYASAARALGEGIHPSLSVDFPTLLGLLEGVGLSSDTSIAPALPYLRSLSTLSGGERSLGEDLTRLRLVFGLQPGG